MRSFVRYRASERDILKTNASILLHILVLVVHVATSGGQSSRSHVAEVRFGDLLDPFGRVGCLVLFLNIIRLLVGLICV